MRATRSWSAIADILLARSLLSPALNHKPVTPSMTDSRAADVSDTINGIPNAEDSIADNPSVTYQSEGKTTTLAFTNSSTTSCLGIQPVTLAEGQRRSMSARLSPSPTNTASQSNSRAASANTCGPFSCAILPTMTYAELDRTSTASAREVCTGF